MASTLERHHEILLQGTIDRIFRLFTPRGELDWVPGWAPTFLDPPDGETRAGMVFRTGAGDEETLWACVDWRPDLHHVKYVRVTPASRFGFVEVHCRAAGPGEIVARVGYTYTALSEAGEALLADLTVPRFAVMIEDWKRLIDAHLSAHAD